MIEVNVESVNDLRVEGGRLGSAAVARVDRWSTAVVGRAAIAATLIVIAICYIATLRPGHVFVNDDFAAYVVHAQNLVEGRAYSDIRYIPNPDAMWISPANGYPPVYPMILAPVYRVFGLDLHAFKVVTVLCFLGFLLLYLEMRGELGAAGSVIALGLLAFNPVVLGQRDFILSEFPYLLFSFAALVAIEKVYSRLGRAEIRFGNVILVAALLYCAYGTRTIGIALVAGLVAADLVKFRRASRFLACVLVATGLCVGAQSLLLTSPKGYASAFHFSLHTVAANTVYYGKTLSYVWQNGVSKEAQIIVALFFTAAAAWGFGKSLWHERGAKEFYLLAYVAVLLAWNSEIGLRGLLPVLPLYFFYGTRECGRFLAAMRLPVRVMAVAALVGIAAVSYAGELRHETVLAAEPNVADADAAEMFAFVRTHTSPEDVLVFPKPRTMALFTGRRVASLSPDQSETRSLEFLRAIHATVLVDADWSETKAAFATRSTGEREIFRNREYRVYRLDSTPDRAESGARDLTALN